jgi:hypothetical protein
MNNISGINYVVESIYKEHTMAEYKEQYADSYDDLNKTSIDAPIEGVDEYELKNYAEDDKVLIDVNDILNDCDEARDRRRSKLESDWDRYRDIYNCRRTITGYQGRSQLFLPAGKDAVDTLTRMSREAILSDPYMSVETDIPEWETVGLNFMKDMVERQGKIREVTPIFLRQLYQLGTSCIELGFKKEIRTVKYRDRDSKQIKDRRMFTHYGPTYHVVDMKAIGVWPETAIDYNALRIVYKDFTLTRDQLQEKADEGCYLSSAVDQAISNHETSNAEWNDANSQASKETGQNQKFEKDVDVTDIWAKIQLPGQECPQWNLITVSGRTILRVIENPFWFQTPPFLFGAIYREQGFFYGHGIIEAIEMWQYMLNDVANQTMDVGTFCLNPIIKYDPALIDDPDLIQIEPGAKVPDPTATFDRPPAQMAIEGMTLTRQILNIIQDSSHANALVQGNPREGLGSAVGTATGVSQLAASANSAVLDQVEELEQQVFTPLLLNTEILCHEFMDEQIVIRTVGQDGVVLTQRVIEPSDLVLSTDIRWVASLRLREQFAKSQQALNFLNIAIKIPPQLTEAQGFRVNYKHLVKMVYAGAGLPGVDDVIEDLTISLPGIPPEFEEQLIAAGKMVDASPVDTIDNHQMHIKMHMTYRAPSELARIRMMQHIASHMQAIHNAQQQQMAMMQQASGGSPTTPQAPIMPMSAPGQGVASPGGPAQEQPTYNTQGAASQGILSQLGGAGNG